MGVARQLSPPFPFVVVSGGWPNDLLAVLSLGLPLLGAYFPSKFHQYFKPRVEVLKWSVPSEVKKCQFSEGTVWLISGSRQFIDGIISFHRPRRLIITVLLKLCGTTVRGARKDRVAAKDTLLQHGLTAVTFLDSEVGGATDASYLMGFGADLGSSVVPTPELSLPRTIHHFVDGGTSGFFSPEAKIL